MLRSQPMTEYTRAKRPLLGVILLAGAALASAAPSCNDCDFVGRRCSGDVVEECGGVDQQIGRTVSETPCGELNPVCVQEGRDAFCAASRERKCEVGSPNRCEGEVRVECKSPGVEVATDCRTIRVLSGQNLVPAGYRCTAPGGARPDCRKPE